MNGLKFGITELQFFLSLAGMSHEPKSPSLGMISAAPCTMATVSPLTPSPISGAMVANGSPASQSAHSGFAAALRKLAKQAEDPRGERALCSSLPMNPCFRHFIISSPLPCPKCNTLQLSAQQYSSFNIIIHVILSCSK